MSYKPIKPQPTLKGYTAWSFNRLIKILGISQAEGASLIIDRWLQSEREHLAEQYRISPREYLEEAGTRILADGGDES